MAIVKVLTAALIQEYLTLISRWSTKLPAAFQLVSPNIQKMLGIPSKESLQGIVTLNVALFLFLHSFIIILLLYHILYHILFFLTTCFFSRSNMIALEDEICQSKLFNHEGFIQLLKEAIGVLREGGTHFHKIKINQSIKNN